MYIFKCVIKDVMVGFIINIPQIIITWVESLSLRIVLVALTNMERCTQEWKASSAGTHIRRQASNIRSSYPLLGCLSPLSVQLPGLFCLLMGLLIPLLISEPVFLSFQHWLGINGPIGTFYVFSSRFSLLRNKLWLSASLVLDWHGGTAPITEGE